MEQPSERVVSVQYRSSVVMAAAFFSEGRLVVGIEDVDKGRFSCCRVGRRVVVYVGEIFRAKKMMS